MKKNLLLAFVAGVLIASVIAIFYYNWVNTQTPSDNNPPTTITIPDNSDNGDENTVIDEEEQQEEEVNNEAGIIVDQEEITAAENALYVSGEANVFEGTVNFRLYGEDDNLIVEDLTTANMPDVGEFGPFEKQINFNAPPQDIVYGYLEVFAYSAKDGSIIDKVTVPVYFQANDTMVLDVYFSHSAPAGMPGECSYVQTVERHMQATSGVARAVIENMLQGPTNQEEAEGFFSGIPEGTELNSISIEDGIAYVDFSSELNMTAGSCGVAGVISMIESNLLQFDTVDDVVISVEGETEAILQP